MRRDGRLHSDELPPLPKSESKKPALVCTTLQRGLLLAGFAAQLQEEWKEPGARAAAGSGGADNSAKPSTVATSARHDNQHLGVNRIIMMLSLSCVTKFVA